MQNGHLYLYFWYPLFIINCSIRPQNLFLFGAGILTLAMQPIYNLMLSMWPRFGLSDCHTII
ncbi:hypothetical protein CLU79DRAFT_776883, partial [Phycomyces nitens]